MVASSYSTDHRPTWTMALRFQPSCRGMRRYHALPRTQFPFVGLAMIFRMCLVVQFPNLCASYLDATKLYGTLSILSNRPCMAIAKNLPSTQVGLGQNHNRRGFSFPILASSTTRALPASRKRHFDIRRLASVSGTVYLSDSNSIPHIVITLFTKESCTLCDKVKETLYDIRCDYPHTLLAVDITDADQNQVYQRYKYDIPVLHINDVYWTKHSLTTEYATTTLQAVRNGSWQTPLPNLEPNAAARERFK